MIDPGKDFDEIGFTAGDTMRLNLKRYRSPTAPTRGPVLLVPGAGVRAELFCAPEKETLVEALAADGWDVWIENWRASIDVPRNEWNLDQAAVYDHPKAVEKIVDVTGADTVKAIIHCQGSSSFALSAAAGLVPQVDTIVSNSMSLHPVVSDWARFKLRWLVPMIAPYLPYVDPRWGDADHAPTNWLAKALVLLVKATHWECRNGPCRMVSFTYGFGRPALWSHENLSERTHDWLRAEFGDVPMSFFAQMSRSVRAGKLLPTGDFSALPPDLLDGPPKTAARFVLLTGEDNHCFLPESQQRTFAYLDGHHPGRHTVRTLPGYGHLDMFIGRYAARDVFPYILHELRESSSAGAGNRSA